MKLMQASKQRETTEFPTDNAGATNARQTNSLNTRRRSVYPSIGWYHWSILGGRRKHVQRTSNSLCYNK